MRTAFQIQREDHAGYVEAQRRYQRQFDQPSTAEHPEILKLDLEAQAALQSRRMFLRPHKTGWWHGYPNPYAVGTNKPADY